MSRMSGYPTFEAHSSYISPCSRRQSRTSPIWGESRAIRKQYLEAMLPFSGQIPGALGLAILEESKEALVDAVDGLEEFINPHGLASYFMRGGVRGYGVAELSGAAIGALAILERPTPSCAHYPRHPGIP